MIYKILKQNNLYHNPDPLFRLVGEANESIVIVEGWEARALLDSGSQFWFLILSYLKLKHLILMFFLLIVPDSAHTQYTPVTLGTLHIDMAIKLATKRELENVNKQWKRSLVATKLTMKEAQIVGVND